jgi:hypothetical protein
VSLMWSDYRDPGEEGREALGAALRDRQMVVVRRQCPTCGAPEDVRYQYDQAVDPLAAGAALPANYVDDGADLSLWRDGRRILSIHTGRPPRLVDATRIHVEDAARGLNMSKEVVLLRASGPPQRACHGAGGRGCFTLKQLAQRLGMLREWSSDDVDWDADPQQTDLMQYVANASTGRYRIYRHWDPNPPISRQNPLWAELAKRGRCPRCEEDHNTKGQSMCDTCVELSLSENDKESNGEWPFDTVQLDPAERQARNASLSWLRAVKHIKRPSGGSNAERGETENELPCVRCRRTTYKAAFWYGYRSICNRCLAPALADNKRQPASNDDHKRDNSQTKQHQAREKSLEKASNQRRENRRVPSSIDGRVSGPRGNGGGRAPALAGNDQTSQPRNDGGWRAPWTTRCHAKEMETD